MKTEKDGVDGDEDPPVPIPNTEVKLICVENTWLATTWEDRTMPSLQFDIAILIKISIALVK